MSSAAPVVLIVDDKPANLLAFEAVLESLDARIVLAASGDEALRHLLSYGDQVAVILLDVQMPGLDGFETAKLIRRRESLRYVPIVFVTAVSREEAQIVRAYASGAVDYLVKPVSDDTLRAKVVRFVELHRRHLHMEEERHENEQRLALAVDAAELGTWSWQRVPPGLVCDARCRSLLDLLPDEPLHPHLFGIHDPIPTATDGRIRNELRTNSGRWLLAQGRVQRTPDGTIERILGVLQDISEQKQAERHRELFLGALGHDLRSPLNAITMASQLIAKRPDPATASLATKVSTAARRMSDLIGDLIEYVRNRTGALPIEPRICDLNGICRSVISEVEQGYPTSRLSFCAGDGAEGVWDPGRLTQVIQNLITNAVQHGDVTEEVNVRVAASADDAVLEVENAGGPIPEQMQSRIFEPFVSGGGGIGLGLYVAHQLVEAHRGRIELVSTPARTLFRVVLPKRALPARTEQATVGR